MAKKLGNVFLLLLVLLASCSFNCVLASPQEQLPLIDLKLEWKRKMISVDPSTSHRANKRDVPPLPPPVSPPLSSPPVSPPLSFLPVPPPLLPPPPTPLLGFENNNF